MRVCEKDAATRNVSCRVDETNHRPDEEPAVESAWAAREAGGARPVERLPGGTRRIERERDPARASREVDRESEILVGG